MQGERGASGEVHAIGWADYGFQRAGWEWRASGHGAVCRRICAAVLRLTDRQADRARQGPRGGDGADAAVARDVCRGGNPYDDPATPKDFRRRGVSRGALRYEVHGAVL